MDETVRWSREVSGERTQFPTGVKVEAYQRVYEFKLDPLSNILVSIHKPFAERFSVAYPASVMIFLPGTQARACLSGHRTP
jgi:hypothetical protein